MQFHVRYDEIALKGGRRLWFEDRLRENVARQLGVPKGQTTRQRGRILVDLPDVDDPAEPLAVIKRTFGVSSASVVHSVEPSMQAIFEVSVRLAQVERDRGRTTFKCEVRRSDKRFPHGSYEIAADVGEQILESVSGLSVDVHEPEFVIGIEVRHEGVFVHCGAEAGPGGVPTGTGGRSLNLLSGGIDSPVAAWFAMKRGLHTDHCYFHAFPYTGDKVLEKVLSIARAVARWTPMKTRVFVPSTTKIQDHIAAHAPERLRIVLLRRSMYRLADAIRRARKYKALITGEALGQVASQTPENLLAVEAVVPETLVLRPLLGLDKVEIIDLAMKIGTYETSILPFQDCCSLFAPKSPDTRASLKRCVAAEADMELAPLEQESLAELTVYKIDRGGPVEETLETIERSVRKSDASPQTTA